MCIRDSDDAEVGAGSILDGCLIGRGSRIPEGVEMNGKIVSHDSTWDDC